MNLLCRMLIFVTLAWAAPAAFGTFATEFLASHPMDIVGQSQTDCGPVSLFNSLQMSGSFNQILRRLPGRAPWEKYGVFLDRYGSKPSGFFAAGPRWNPEVGTQIDDLRDMGNDFAGAAEFRAVSAARVRGEVRGALLARVLRDLRGSLEENFAPVIFIGFRATDGRLLSEHALIVTDIQGDRMMAYDSRDFVTISLRLRERTDKSFFVWVQEKPGDLQAKNVDWSRFAIEGEAGAPVISPLLIAEGRGLWPSDLPQGIMTVESYLTRSLH